MVLIPPKDPRLIVPARRTPGARAVMEALQEQSGRARLRRAWAAGAVLAGLGVRRLPEPAVLGPVRQLLNMRQSASEHLTYGIHLGPPRANRKPVIAIARQDGQLVAFIKCGVDAVTDSLIRHEAAVLRALPSFTNVVTPQVIAVDTYEGHAYSVLTPVPREAHRGLSPALLAEAQVEVATKSVAQDTGVTVSGAAYGERMRKAWTARGEGHLAESWISAGGTTLRFGAWHGDWRRTNIATNGTRCSVWDWERYDPNVPLGFDALHMCLTEATSTKDLTELPRLLERRARELLSPFGVRDEQERGLTVTGYLLEIASRYLDENQKAAGARLGDVQAWLLPYVRNRLTELTAEGELQP